MSTSMTKAQSVPATLLRWAGCLLGTVLVLFLVVMAIGLRPPLTLLAEPLTWALLVMGAGFLLAWWNGLVGGIASLVGIGAFYALNYAAAGVFPGGWVLPLCIVPGVLCVLAWVLGRMK